MPSIISRKNEVVQEFHSLDEWEDKYLMLIDSGERLPNFPEVLKNEKNRVAGCTSRVWITGVLDVEDKLHLSGDSDSRVVKGLLSILIRIYSGATAQEILSDNSDIISDLKLGANLMPTRVTGVQSMQKRIWQIAQAAS